MADNTTQQNRNAEARPAAAEVPASEAPPGTGLRAKLLDRATKAKEQAQSSLSSLVGKSEGLKEAAAMVEEMKDAGLVKVLETLDDFNNALPVLREAGYTLEGITLGLGIPPKLVADFAASQEASSVNVERLLAQHAENKLTVVLVKALHNAWLVQTKITVRGLKATKLSVEVGLTPSVSAIFG